jgi:bifunctional non-homologous end joining protein LigD
MGLERYREKRDFGRTPEPRGRRARADKGKGRSFVVHKHAARRLHYDLRLEMDGVYRSWAVPKGPSLDPAEKRLAVFVEDHPLEYGEFEGIIPPGEYGGGTVLLWDRGSWAPVGDAEEGLRKGDFKFELHGEKLRGRFVLVRLRKDGLPDEKNWLLIKETDDEARSLPGGDVLEEMPLSVKTARTLDEITLDADAAWVDGKIVKPGKKASKSRKAAPRRKPRGEPPVAADIPGARKAKLDPGIRPQLATLSRDVPRGDGWVHEIKYDGYRALTVVEAGKARVYTRNNHDWTDRFDTVAGEAATLPCTSAHLDGEVAVLLPDGATSFQALQGALKRGRSKGHVYFVFDLLHLDGHDLRRSPLLERKKALRRLLDAAGLGEGVIRFSDHIEGDGLEVVRQASRLQVEGIVSKREDSRYVSKRTSDWVKIKFQEQDTFVVGGFTEPVGGTRDGFGALLVGKDDGKGRLVYRGRVGTGFTDAQLVSLRERLEENARSTPPFVDPPRGSMVRAVHWVEPLLMVEVEYTGSTGDGLLRHPSFVGLREDLMESAPSPVEKKGSRARTAIKKSSRKPRGRPIRLLDGLHLTSPDRVFYPDRGITKLDLCHFYAAIESWILPHVEERILSLVRCPEGVGGETFYQKQWNDSVPDVVGRVAIREKGGKPVTSLYVRDLASLVGLVQIGVLEIHVWGSRIDRPDHPDRMILDLDPDPMIPWNTVLEAAVQVRDELREIELESFVKTTGGKGLHVVVPLARRNTFPEVLAFSEAFARSMERRHPSRYVSTSSLSRRRGRIYLDYQRNARGATAIAAYSTRASEKATVSVPLSWDELEDCLGSDYWHVQNLPRRLQSLEEDPWKDIDTLRQGLTAKVRRRLEG